MKQSSAKSDLAKLFEKAGAPKFAVGGLSDTSLLSIAASGVRPYYTQEEKDWLAAREREYADYNKAVEAYNQQVSDYQKQIDAYNESIKPYQSEVDAYNKALEDYNRGVEAYRKSLFIAEDNTPRIYEKSASRGGWSGRVKDPATGAVYDVGSYYTTLGDDNATLIARQNPTNVVELNRQLIGRGSYRYTDPRTGQVVYEGGTGETPKITRDYMAYGGKLYEFEKTPGEFTAKMPGTPPAPFSAVAPTAPTNVPYTQEQVKQYSEAAKARAQKSAAQRSSALNVAASPEQYGLSGFGLSLPFKDGGEVSNEDFIQQMTVGTPMTPQEQAQPSMSREAFERFKEVAPGLIGTIPQAALTVAGNLRQAATEPKEFTKRALTNIATQLKENPEEFIMNWTGGGLGGVLKPKGGIFPKAGSGSGIDNYLNRVEEMVGREAQDLTIGQIKTLNEFIRDKGRKYLTSTYTSGSDPLKEALLEGRMPALGTDAKNFRDYMLQAVREGNPGAVEDFERIYDTKSGLGQFVVTPSNYEQAAKIRVDASRQMLDKIAKEGVPENLVTEPFVRRVEIEDMFKDYSPEYQKNLARNLLNQELGMTRPVDVVDETLIRAAREGEVFYDLPSQPALDFLDPTNLAKSLSTLNPDKLANMSFAEAVIQGTKNTRLQRDWDEVIKKVENNKSVPREMFDIGVEKVRPMGEDRWVRLITPQAVQLEGAAMHHSVGGYAKKGSYGEGGRDALISGRAQVFSLRGPDNRPRITIEARKNDDGSLLVKQIKGNFNGVPEPKDQELVVQFLKDLPIDKIQPESYARSATGEELAERVRIDWSEKAGFGARSIF